MAFLIDAKRLKAFQKVALPLSGILIRTSLQIFIIVVIPLPKGPPLLLSSRLWLYRHNEDHCHSILIKLLDGSLHENTR